MKLSLALLALLTSVAIATDPQPPSIDQILADEALQQKYFACLVDKGPCTPGATQFKRVLGDLLTSDCASCTEHQKSSANKVIQFAQTHKPDLFKLVEQKYDPTGAYRARSATHH